MVILHWWFAAPRVDQANEIPRNRRKSAACRDVHSRHNIRGRDGVSDWTAACMCDRQSTSQMQHAAFTVLYSSTQLMLTYGVWSEEHLLMTAKASQT